MFSRAQRLGRRRAAAVDVERLEGRRLFCFDVHGLPEVTEAPVDVVAADAPADVPAVAAPVTREWWFDIPTRAAMPSVISPGGAPVSAVRAEAPAATEAAAAEPVTLRAAADTYV